MNPTGRLLVVDDEKLIRFSVTEGLERRGHEVASADSGERALELIASHRPLVALLDVQLPGIDGLETLQRALLIDPDLVVVMMSAHGTIDLAVQAMNRGAVDFVVKPFQFDALAEAVERALARALTRRQIAAFGEGPVTSGGLVGESAVMVELREIIRRVAASDTSTVVLEGESGSGKEVVAHAIHGSSRRAAKPFLKINCAALPELLVESELFGHERGAFTDARAQKRGLFEMAEEGSVMLDEIGDLPAGSQAKLLRLLEERSFRRVGGVAELKSDVRVIAATNVGLKSRVADGRFRADLFFRLNVVRLEVPTLRARATDIPLLSALFVGRYNQEMKRAVTGISPDALALMTAYPWPGNVRELRNAIERAFILHPGAEQLRVEHLPHEVREHALTSAPLARQGSMSLDETERRLLMEAMESCRGNQSQAARILGVSRDTLRYRLKKHGLA